MPPASADGALPRTPANGHGGHTKADNVLAKARGDFRLKAVLWLGRDFPGRPGRSDYFQTS